MFEWNTNELEKLKIQKGQLKLLVSDVQTKIQECTDSAERNHRLAKECSRIGVAIKCKSQYRGRRKR